MSQNATEIVEASQSGEKASRASGESESPENVSGGLESGSGEGFSREYVEELRRESAKHRQNAKKADELARRLVASYVTATGRLHDARDLAFSDDLLDSDGYPDVAKVSEAVEALIVTRPHLAKIRPVGDVGQGIHESSPSALTAFGSFLRG